MQLFPLIGLDGTDELAARSRAVTASRMACPTKRCGGATSVGFDPQILMLVWVSGKFELHNAHQLST